MDLSNHMSICGYKPNGNFEIVRTTYMFEKAITQLNQNWVLNNVLLEANRTREVEFNGNVVALRVQILSNWLKTVISTGTHNRIV